MFEDNSPHKLQVARQHVVTAVLLTGLNADVRSIHVLVMAADEIILAYAKATDIALAMNLDGMIRTDKTKEWLRAKRKAYNYFKHADVDAEVEYDGPDAENLTSLNDLMLLQAITSLRQLGIVVDEASNWMWRLVLALNPHLVAWDNLPDALQGQRELLEKGADRKSMRVTLLASASNTRPEIQDLWISASRLRPYLPQI